MESDFERLSRSLGSLLLVWAKVEKAVREEIIRINDTSPKAVHGISAALKQWESEVINIQPSGSLGPLLVKVLRSQLQTPIEVRNGICHGLDGISMAADQLPASLIWEINGQKNAICWDDLQAQLNWLSRLPRAISVMSNPQLEKLGNRAQDSRENRAWWRSEFLLDLPEA